MPKVEQLAKFVVQARFEDISERARLAVKSRIPDAIGCALLHLFGGGTRAPDRAAFFNSALIRYLDFNDSYLAKGETCHPSDNLGAVLAACEYANRTGREFLTALAVSYQVQCRLSDMAPVRARGFDHTTQGAYAVAAGVGKGPQSRSNPDRACSRDLWDQLQCAAGHANGRALELEGIGLR
jgi:2-methylcitrate dehydratase